MKLTIDRNCNIIINGQPTGYVAVGAHSISGQTSLHKGAGTQKVEGGHTTHVTEVQGAALWSGHVTALTADVFAKATGFRQPDTIVISAPRLSKSS